MNLGIDLIIVLFLASLIVGVLILVVGVLFHIVPGLKEFWLSKPLVLRKWFFYQFVGLSLLGVIIFALSIPIKSMMELEDWVIDGVMSGYQENIPSINAREIPPFVLLDIDNKTHISWGEPSYTPRDKLKNLIDTAVQAKARLIIVDIDISKSPLTKNGPLPDDLVLAKYLKNYATKCKQNQSDCSPIILVRAFSYDATSKSNLLTPRIGFFEDVVTQSFPYVQWGMAELILSIATKQTRRWSLWEATCTKEQQPGVIPSMALLTMGIIRGCGKYGEEIRNTLDSLKPENCSQFLPPESINFCGLTTSTNIDSVQQRIMYRMPYSPAPATVHDNQGDTVLTILSAKPYAEESPPPDSLEVFNDSVVVIGGSYGPLGCPPAGNDIHCTPIGEMPGALVIINAIYSLLQDLTIKPVSYWWLVIAFVIIITLFSLIPEKPDKTVIHEQPNNPWYKTIIWWLIIIIVVGLFIYSFILFEDGTWLDIAVPVAIIAICQKIYQLKWPKKMANKVLATTERADNTN